MAKCKALTGSAVKGLIVSLGLLLLDDGLAYAAMRVGLDQRNYSTPITVSTGMGDGDRQTDIHSQVILYLSNAHALHWTDNNVKLIIHRAKSCM